MYKKIVIASDSFKGSLSSLEVAEAAENAIRSILPDCEIVKVDVADGGEGTMEALCRIHGGHKLTLEVNDPLGRPVDASYLILADGSTAVIEMAAASGLPLLHPDERNPLLTSTYGTGQLIADALGRGCRKFLIGIGGSATNDAGIGMLEALGVRFYDAEGKVLPGRGDSLNKVETIDMSGVLEELPESEFIVACDVESPFCGPEGAAFVYAPQKGATAQMVKDLDEGMYSFSRLIYQKTGTDVKNIKGAGAAGGLGGTLRAFMNADLKKGADMLLDAVSFDRAIEGADLIITGEGCIDGQTLTGKLPYTVAQRASSRNIPIIAICGRAEVEHLPCFDRICPVTPSGLSLDEAMNPQIAAVNIFNTIVSILGK
jgi:glycerate kinase